MKVSSVASMWCIRFWHTNYRHQTMTQILESTELTTRFGWESVRLTPKDLGHCPRRRSRLRQWARSRGISPDSHTKRVDNSGSATTFLATNTFIMMQNVFFCLKGECFFLKCRPSLLFWSRDTNRPISIKKMGLLPCQLVVVPQKRSFRTTALPAGCSPMGLRPGPGRASSILNELESP